MPEKSGWLSTGNLRTLVDQCEYWNSGRLYEILWEYRCLSPLILRDRKARGWLYYEKGRLAGFALGRRRRGWWHLEELWGPCEGLSEIDRPFHPEDIARANLTRILLGRLGGDVIIRAAVDNAFANTIAEFVGANWCGGFLLSKRRLGRKCDVSIPPGVSLRRFKIGDGGHLSRIHQGAFGYRHPPGEYVKWAMKKNCKTTLAMMNGRPVGFLIAEERRYAGYGDFMIAVEPNSQSRGVGSSLLENGLKDLRDMGVKTVIADFLLLNAPAQALYRKHSFQIVRAYNYYRWKKDQG